MITVSYEEIPTLAGRDLGYSDYLEVTQERINTFAEATGDFQYIHVDSERAKSGPFGTTVAHGLLTLSLAVPMRAELLQVDGQGAKVSYGFEKVRFVSPVPAGIRIRLRATVAAAVEVTGGYQLTVDEVTELENGEKPAVVARVVFRFYA